MIKRYFIFLLLLMSVLGSVNATTPTVPETCTPTDFYVVLDDSSMTSELITTQLQAIDFNIVAPSVSGVENNRIYFSSKSDLARFCAILSYTNPSLPFSGAFSVYTEDGFTPVSVLKIYGTYAPEAWVYSDLTINSSKSQLAYIYSQTSNGQYSGDSISNNGVQFFYYSGGSTAVNGAQYDEIVLLSNNVLTYGCKGGGYDPRVGRVMSSLVVFDYIEYEYSGSLTLTLTELYTPPEQGNISIYSAAGTEVYESSYLLGTTDNGGLLDIQLPMGEHTLKFIKDGYWDVFKTITVSENTSEIYVTMAPSNAIFQVEKEFSGNIYPNSIARLSLDVTPVKTAYATKLRVSGVEVNKVYYNTQELPKAADGSYIIGDISSPQNIVIDFKTTSSWGERTFTVELSATDIEGTAYTNLETINYNVLELPFLFEAPDSWAIGTNEVTLTDMSGESYSVLLVLYDESGTEKWSSSTNLLEYCEYTFEVPIEDAGEYILELNAKSGSVKSYYSVEIIEPVSLVSDFLTANPGKVATVQFKISNPTESVKYYKASLSCPFYNDTIDKTFSIAPGTVDKTVDMSFEVPEDLEMEYYQLTLEVFDEGKTDPIYSGHVVLTISNASLLIASVPGGNTTLIILASAVMVIAGTFAALRLKK
ncbi:hypothetical protein HNP94_001929 [Methanococcus maripaludis]|uniref:PEGA domain-containing protein n=1 Tax=Methanococcus maripaludis TaxID=39152 RepID=A0A7J9PQ88_METMI|nr:hypothetical protein [Methanococcus maripaludis]